MFDTTLPLLSPATMPEAALRKACEASGFRLIIGQKDEEKEVCVPPNVELRWTPLSPTEQIYHCEMLLPDDRHAPFGRAVVVLTSLVAVVTFKWMEWRQNGKVVIVSLQEDTILRVI